MSKKIRLQTAALLAVVLILAAFAPALRVTRAQAQSATATVTADAKRAAVVEATTEVLKETSELRQLPIIRQVKSDTQSRADIERFLIKNLDEDTTPAEMHATEVSLKKLGLVPQDFQFRPFIIKLLTEQVAGYYDPKQQEFFLADWIDLDGQKPVMAHELTHALQDQHFNLRRFDKWPKGDSDAELAAHALIEGDASLAMTVYVTRNPARIIALMKSMGASQSATEEIDRAPRALRESLLFPYQEGMQWVTQLYKKEGWPLVSKAFTDLPQSTEQILHADKYFAHDAPIKLTQPDIASALGSGWKRIDSDVNGEWSYYLILDEYLKSEQESRRAAAGWGGDRYSVYEDAKTGAVFISQTTAWDTEQDAQEFFAAYAKRTELRYMSATALESKAGGANTEEKAWRTDEGNVLLQRRGSRVLILEGVPEGKDARALSLKLWS
ncbi:MAG TPA: hypothetical protein VF779_04525 [Pyrinomonadaceae bacterium]